MKRLIAFLSFAFAVFAHADSCIQFSGTQCVDTGYYVTGRTAIVADFEMTDTTTQQQLVWSAGTKLWNRLYVNSSCNWAWSCQNWNTGDPGKDAKTDNTATSVAVDASRLVAMVDGYNNHVVLSRNGVVLYERTSWAESLPHTETSDSSLKIGCRFAENRFYASMKLYSFKIYEAGELVRDYVPARQDGIVGLYDRKQGGFIYDTRMPLGGDHCLTASGELMELEAGYIESTGDRSSVACGMNARMRAYADVRVEVDFAFRTIKEQDRVFGADGRPCLYVNSENKLTFSCGAAAKTMVVQRAPDTDRHTVVVDYFTRRLELKNGPTVFWESSIGESFDPLESSSPMPFALFGNMNSTAGSDGHGFRYRHQSNVRIYGAKFYRAGHLVHDYRPCVKGGVAGFRDHVGGDFIRGEIADAFTAGGAVERISDDPYVMLTGNNANAGEGKWIDTGYLLGPTTKIVFDYALADDYPGSGQWTLMGAWTAAVGEQAAERFNVEANTVNALQWRNGTGTSWTSVSASLGTAANQRNVRRQLTYDAAQGTLMLVTAGFTNEIATATSTLSRRMVDRTLRLGCNTDVVPVNFAPLKIYGLRIYEGEELVRDFIPYVKNGLAGIFDTKTGVFAVNGGLPLDCGGPIATDGNSKDAYIEFSGAQTIDTGVYPTGDTAVFADFQLTSLEYNPQQFIWGSSNDTSDRLYTNSGGKWSWFGGWNAAKIGGSETTLSLDRGRLQVMVDPYSKTTHFDREGHVLWSSSSFSPAGNSSVSTLKIGSRFAGNAGEWNFASMKLYAFKVYEAGRLIRDYVPCQTNGVVGLYDRCFGTFCPDIQGTSPLKLGGAGDFAVKPHDATIPPNGATTLSALAGGALAYQWYLNGEAVEGETNATFSVAWRAGSQNSDEVKVVPFYDVFGERTSGTPQVAMVTYQPRGLLILIK